MRWTSGAAPSWTLLLRVAAYAVSASIAQFTGQEARAKVVLDADVVLTQVPRQAHTDTNPLDSNRLLRNNRCEGARIVVVSPDGKVQVLSDGFASACDPNVSVDA